MTAVLRRSSTGYRTTQPVECPSCHQSFDLAARVAEDRDGKHFVMWAIERRPGEYSPAELRHVMHGPPQDVLVTGVALPQEPGRVRLPADPVPTFEREDR